MPPISKEKNRVPICGHPVLFFCEIEGQRYLQIVRFT